MLEIPLTGAGAGRYAKVDPKDYRELMKHSWYYKDGYAVTKINRREVRMHRYILNEDDPEVIVDHRNRDRLDNRRSNLRRFTLVQNANNRNDNIFIEAFGEKKTISQWSRDSRCCVAYETLRRRLESGIPAWAAIMGKDDDLA